MKNHPTVQPNHTFFWRTEISEERMKKISEWIGSLDDEEHSLLIDLISDIKEEENYFSQRYG